MDPIQKLREWLAPGEPGVDGFFPLIALATVDAAGRPDVRHVLLSEIADDVLYFHTDSRSRKAADVAGEPSVALALHLPESRRQVTATGVARPAGADELSRAYRHRSRYLQILAWLNTDEMAALPPSEKLRLWSDFEQTHPEGSLRPPETWCGFGIRPDRMTFWEGAADRPSHRVEFRRIGKGWQSTDLAG